MKNWKKQTGVWIDSFEAVIVTLFDGRENITEIKSDVENRIYHDDEGYKGTFSGDRHGNNEAKFNERKKNQLDHFLTDVISHGKFFLPILIWFQQDQKYKVHLILLLVTSHQLENGLIDFFYVH